jgi:hypothetical protein
VRVAHGDWERTFGGLKRGVDYGRTTGSLVAVQHSSEHAVGFKFVYSLETDLPGLVSMFEVDPKSAADGQQRVIAEIHDHAVAVGSSWIYADSCGSGDHQIDAPQGPRYRR